MVQWRRYSELVCVHMIIGGDSFGPASAHLCWGSISSRLVKLQCRPSLHCMPAVFGLGCARLQQTLTALCSQVLQLGTPSSFSSFKATSNARNDQVCAGCREQPLSGRGVQGDSPHPWRSLTRCPATCRCLRRPLSSRSASRSVGSHAFHPASSEKPALLAIVSMTSHSACPVLMQILDKDMKTLLKTIMGATPTMQSALLLPANSSGSMHILIRALHVLQPTSRTCAASLCHLCLVATHGTLRAMVASCPLNHSHR